MIRFNCPSCKSVLQVADNHTGAMAACPKCKAQMTVPVATPAHPNPAPIVSEPPDQPTTPAQGQRILPWWKRALSEVQETASATWGQVVRLICYLRGLWQKRSLDKANLDAQRRLGNRIYEAGGGDPTLRSEIATLDEMVRQAEVNKESTKALQAERETLILQLAANAVAQPDPIPGVEAEHAKAKEAHVEAQRHDDAMTVAKTDLPPKDRTAWRRVVIGFGTVSGVFLLGSCIMCGGMASFFRGKPSGDVADVRGMPGGNNPAFPKDDHFVDFSKVDYTTGPQGQKLETKKDNVDGTIVEFTGFFDAKKNFIKHGKTTLFFPGGQKEQETWYFNGQPHGEEKIWHQNGQLSSQGSFKDGKQHGKWLLWNENGKLDEESYWLNGKQHGPVKKWDQNGQLFFQGTMKDHKWHGQYTEWNEKKDVAIKVQFVEGYLS